jgi:hypothetical protein
MAAEKERSEGGGRARHRSPSYPGNDLATCLGWAQRFWEAEKRSSASTLIAVKHCGYSSISGPSKVAISSMRKFGLFEDDGVERVKLSHEAIAYVSAPVSMRAEMAKKLALNSDTIREFVELYADGLPSDDNLFHTLVSGRGFGAEAARIFLSVLKKTTDFARLYEHGGSYDGAPVQETESPVQEMSTRQADSAGRFNPGSGEKLQYGLSTGTVEVYSSQPFTPDAIDELVEYLTLYRKVVVKRSLTNV